MSFQNKQLKGEKFVKKQNKKIKNNKFFKENLMKMFVKKKLRTYKKKMFSNGSAIPFNSINFFLKLGKLKLKIL